MAMTFAAFALTNFLRNVGYYRSATRRHLSVAGTFSSRFKKTFESSGKNLTFCRMYPFEGLYGMRKAKPRSRILSLLAIELEYQAQPIPREVFRISSITITLAFQRYERP